MIDGNVLLHWVTQFYGYGTWSAPLWFVGYEESGGDSRDEVAEKLNHFYRAYGATTGATLCDIRSHFQEVAFRVEGPRAERFNTFYDHRFGENAVVHGLWKNLIAFAHGYRNIPLPDTLSYQRNHFLGLSSGEAMIQLYPLPAHSHAWYYSWLDLPGISFLKSRSLYEKHVYQDRIETILEKAREHKPEVVLMYGMENINVLKASIQEAFPAAKFRMIKGIKQITPQHHRTDVNGTTFLLTTQIPALRHNRKETGFDWENLGRMISSG